MTDREAFNLGFAKGRTAAVKIMACGPASLSKPGVAVKGALRAGQIPVPSREREVFLLGYAQGIIHQLRNNGRNGIT